MPDTKKPSIENFPLDLPFDDKVVVDGTQRCLEAPGFEVAQLEVGQTSYIRMAR